MNALPGKQELLDFQARWMRPAGLCAIVGALIFAVALPLQQAGAGDNDAERLTKFHEHSTELIFAQGILVSIPFLLFTPLLYLLIRAARGRTERIPRQMVALAFVGPILFALSSMLLAVGLNDVSGKFIDQAPAKEQQARQQATTAQTGAAKSGSAKPSKPASKGQATTTTTPQPTTTPKTPDQAASSARDDLASNLIDDSGLLKAGSLLRFIGFLGLVFALIYIPLWSMRTGLLTRFWATFGMAFGVSLLLVPFGVLGLVLWFAAVGLMVAGWWPITLPPAWAAGEAIPWQSGRDIGPPPEQPGPPGTVEGSGREVSQAQSAGNGGPAGASGEAPAQPGETQGQRRKKRKRRK